MQAAVRSLDRRSADRSPVGRSIVIVTGIDEIRSPRIVLSETVPSRFWSVKTTLKAVLTEHIREQAGSSSIPSLRRSLDRPRRSRRRLRQWEVERRDGELNQLTRVDVDFIKCRVWRTSTDVGRVSSAKLNLGRRLPERRCRVVARVNSGRSLTGFRINSTRLVVVRRSGTRAPAARLKVSPPTVLSSRTT